MVLASNGVSMIDNKSDILDMELHSQRPSRGKGVEKAIRCLAVFVLLWSVAGLGVLYWLTHSQPRTFMPLILREDDSEESRTAAIESWRQQYIPTNTRSLMRDRSPIVRYDLDAQLTELPASGHWMHAVDPREKPASFKKRLYELNVGVEMFLRDYWSRAWTMMESLVATAVFSLLCITFPRILPSCILLVVAGFVQLDAAKWVDQEPSLLWFLPIVGTACLITCLAIYRWRVTPADAEVTQNWNKFWLGLLLTSIGIGAFVAILLWGGRVRTNGLAGIGLSFGWGVYLVAVHGWKLVRSLFTKPPKVE